MQRLMMGWLVGAAVVLAGAAWAEDAPVAVQTVDALQALFGKHAGYRANHAKGVVAEGTFTPTAEAATLTRAAPFQGPAVKVTVRFSDATGVPEIPDGDVNANPHGLAIKFHLADGSDTDVVTNSLKFFPVADITDFRDLLLAVAASPPGAAKPTPLEKFFASHPAALPAFGSVATPASFATEQYNGVDAFVFVNKAGAKTTFRYRIDPVAGVQHLDAAAAAAKPPNYLRDDLTQRLASGPVAFKLLAQIANPGDPTNDATKPWPADRKLVQLGTLSVTGLATEDKTLVFLPSQLTDGIEESDDPLIDERTAAYAESFGRRSQ